MATFYNQATLSYNGREVVSNITVGETVEVLRVTKNALADTYAVGDTVTYVVSLINTGSSALSGLTLSDDLGAFTGITGATVVPLDYLDGSLAYYVNGVLQPTPTVSTVTALTVTGLDVPAGGNAQLIYQARVNEFASPEQGGSVTNTVTLSGAGISTVTAQETVTAASGAQLSISKSLSPSVVPENGQLTYTFVIRNTGNAAAQTEDNVAISDSFDPVLSGVTVTYGGAAWTSPTNYTYNETTGAFNTVAGQITVPAATYTQDAETGAWIVTPGTVELTVTGTI